MKENICEYGLLKALASKISWDTFNMVGCFDRVKIANMKSQNSAGFICWWHAETRHSEYFLFYSLGLEAVNG